MLRTIEGSATLRTVVSRLMSSNVTHSTESVAQWRRVLSRRAVDPWPSRVELFAIGASVSG